MTSTPPRSIDGSIGSKIRIILGETGDSWLLLLNHDDGNSKWQEQQWSSGIPHQLAKQINNCIAKDRYIKEVDFGPNNEWYVHGIKRDGSGGHNWWGNTKAGSAIKEETITSSSTLQVSFGSDVNPESYGYDDDDDDDKLETYAILVGRNGHQVSNSIDNDLSSRMGRIHEKNKAINFIRLFNNGGYFISDDEGTEWKGVGEHCAKQLQKNGTKEDVSVAGDGSWIVIHSDGYNESTGVDGDLCQHLTKFYNDQRERKNRRNLGIQEYHARIRREEAREREEREEHERIQRHFEDAERLELERQREIEAAAFLERQQQREAAEQEAQEERERASSSRLTNLLVDRINNELKDISEQEERLKKKRRSLQASIEEIPPQARARIDGDNSTATNTTSSNTSSSPATANCVICQVAPSSQAIIPCGHCCLCDECATTLTDGPPQTRLCPLCRTRIQSCLKVFLSTG